MKLKLHLQHDETDCAAACLQMILDYYGKSTNLRKLRMIAGTDTKGTTGYGLSLCAKENGLSCKGFNAPEKSIISQIPFPAIFHVQKDSIEHYVVVKEIKKDKIKVYDPGQGIVKIPLKDFLTWWTGIFFLCKPQEDFVQEKDDSSPLMRFFSLLKPHKGLISKIVAASLVLSFLEIFIAFYFRFLIDEVLYSQVKSTLNITSLCYLFVLIFQLILSFSRNQLSIIMGTKIDLTLLCEFFNHLVRLPLSFFTSRKTGEILSRIRDTENIRHTISSTTVSVLIDSVMIFVGAFFLIKTGSTLIFAAIAPVLISSLLVCLFARPFRLKIKQRAIAEANKTASMYESINGIATIKALSTEKNTFRRNEIICVDAANKGISLEFLGNINRVIQTFVSSCGTLLIYWLGSLKIMNGTLSLGQLISFTTLSGFFLGPLSRLLTMQPMLQEAMVSAERLWDILDLKEEDNCAYEDEDILFTDKIEFNNVDFSYGTRGRTLKGLNFSIKKGEKIAVVGSSGSGKSTLIKLLLKFYKCEDGNITLDGKDINMFSNLQYRKLFGYVPQDTLLFSGTIGENIAWGNERDINTEKIIQSAKEAQALSFIYNLPQGFKTLVGEQGATLSGGEKQRIALARILMRKPQILVLDEATASLDSLCEKSIMKTINNLTDKTMIIVAHRLSTIRNCDRIIVMDKGHIVEIGKHKELLGKKGKYTELWEAQNEK